MSAEFIVTLVMGVALAGLILTQLRGLRGEVGGLRGDTRELSTGMDRVESALDRLREAIADRDRALFGLAPKPQTPTEVSE